MVRVLLILAGVAVLVVALFGIVLRTNRPERHSDYEGEAIEGEIIEGEIVEDYAPEDPARALFAAAGDEPPTEDQIAQARLGGPRGAPQLGAAPMSRKAAENTPRPIDDGHVA